MKAKEILYLAGLKPKPRKYGHVHKAFNLCECGTIEYAQWLHPKAYSMEFDEKQIIELKRFIKPGDTVIDVGAHAGDSTIPCAIAAGPEGCVLAFEPNPYVFPVLEENSRLNTDKTRIIPLNYAATEEDGELEFEYSDPGFCNGGRHTKISRWRHGHAFNLKVTGRNLDRLIEDEFTHLGSRISYVKTDAEGYDLSVLKSMKRILQRHRPAVQSEIYKLMVTEERHGLIDLMESMDYRITMHSNEAGYGTGEPISHDNVDSWRNFDVFCEPMAA